MTARRSGASWDRHCCHLSLCSPSPKLIHRPSPRLPAPTLRAALPGREPRPSPGGLLLQPRGPKTRSQATSIPPVSWPRRSSAPDRSLPSSTQTGGPTTAAPVKRWGRSPAAGHRCRREGRAPAALLRTGWRQGQRGERGQARILAVLGDQLLPCPAQKPSAAAPLLTALQGAAQRPTLRLRSDLPDHDEQRVPPQLPAPPARQPRRCCLHSDRSGRGLHGNRGGRCCSARRLARGS